MLLPGNCIPLVYRVPTLHSSVYTRGHNTVCGWCTMQVDTPGKKLLLGIAVGYLSLVLLVPTVNVFVQVASPATSTHNICSANLICDSMLGRSAYIQMRFTQI